MSVHRGFGVIFFLFCLFGAGTCGYLLYVDMFLTSSSTEGLEKAGIIGDKEESVKRKSSDAMLWESLETRSRVYWNDAVQSGEKSKAVIYIEGGIKLKLGESSLVVLEKQNGKPFVNLRGGKLTVDMSEAAKNASLKINGLTMGKNSRGIFKFDRKKGLLGAVRFKSGAITKLSMDERGRVSRQMGMLKNGHLLLFDPKKVARSIASIPKPVIKPTTEISFTVQLGSFAKEEQASERVNELRDKGVSAFYVVDRSGGQVTYHVNTGLFAERDSAAQFSIKLKNKHKDIQTADVKPLIQ